MTNGSENMVMPVAPMYGGMGSGFGNSFGYDGWWILLLLLFAGGGWGNGFGGGFGGGMYEFPWLLNGQQGINTNTNAGFRDAMLNDGITSIRDGISSLSTQLCGCCGDMQMALANGFSNAESSANARQIANMQTAFGMQTAMNQGFNSLGSQLAQCCCDQRLATCQTQNIIQSESAATRFADANNTRDIIQSQSNGTQAILDKLCQLELDGYKRENDSLRTQLTAANFRESQTAQNALISQGFANEVDQLYNRLNNCPVPTTPVYGRTPIFTCNQNSGCGCNGSFYN
jgi:hypothetical protein